MMNKEEKKQLLITMFYDKKANTLNLSGFDFGDMEVDFSNTTAKIINNKCQEAKEIIFNSMQESSGRISNVGQVAHTRISNFGQSVNEDIDNSYQKAYSINNDHQIEKGDK